MYPLWISSFVSKSKVKPIFKEVYCVNVGGYISKKLTQSDVLVVLKYMHVGKIATESLKNWILRSDTDPKIFQFRVMMNHSKELGWWCSKSFNKSQQQKFFQTNSSHTMVSCHIQKSSCGLDKLCKAIATTSLCEIEVDEVRGREEAYFSLHFGQKSKKLTNQVDLISEEKVPFLWKKFNAPTISQETSMHGVFLIQGYTNSVWISPYFHFLDHFLHNFSWHLRKSTTTQ